MVNDSRRTYESMDVIEDVLDFCQGDWVLIFALARFAGLRVPSEFARLRWKDVNWNKHTIDVDGKKTKSWRVMPIFPPLNRYLLSALGSIAR